jgi:uncharacterized metal-binding protein YceD (DUF177 family)
MSKASKYVIPYSGLKEGNHSFDFTVNKGFFEDFGEEVFDDANANIKVEMQKLSTMLILDFFIKGTITTFCDRCGDDLILPFESENRLYVKYGDGESEDEDVLILPQSEYQIDVSNSIYEYFLVSVPSRIIHIEGECNEEVMKKLNELAPKLDADSDRNPIWDKLKKLN